MTMVMIVTLPGGTELECNVTETICQKNGEFFNFKAQHKQSGQSVTVRVETKENFTDRKTRGC